MLPTKKDKKDDILLKFLIPLVKIWMLIDMKTKYHYDKSFDIKRTDPYVLLGNHTFMFDVVHVPLQLKKQPFIVANENLFTKQPLKFLLTRVAHAIPKSKGASDLRTAKQLIGAVKRGYPICIYPEGNTTFNGETTRFEESTFKLIKKLKVDVVTCKAQGGHLSKPRWATEKRKNRQVDLHYKVAITKEEVAKLSVTEIADIVNAELYNNDYEYQREVQIPHPGKKLAHGLENILYICPECESVNTLVAKDNTLTCTACNNEGQVNDLGFIEGFRFDNTVEWDHFQKQFVDKLKQSKLVSKAKLFTQDDSTNTRKFVEDITLVSENETFIFKGQEELIIPFDEVHHVNVTLRRNLNIYHNGTHYFLKVDEFVSSFLRVFQSKY